MTKILLLALFAVAGLATAAPIISVSVTGTSGNYIYDFSVSNTLGGTNNINYFGVALDSSDTVGSPSVFEDFGPWQYNHSFGGSTTLYSSSWIDEYALTLQPGLTLGGFKVHSSKDSIATSIKWFAFADGGTYLGGDNFSSPDFPGFEGTVSPVPEPASMIALGFGALALFRRHKKA
ncbi:MAG: PEP-CTERM sorting domain-containing protein [Fimbriimonas sp.]